MGSGNGTGWNCIALMLNTKITVSHPISTTNIVISGKVVNVNMDVNATFYFRPNVSFCAAF